MLTDERIRAMAHPLSRLESATEYQAIIRVENRFGWSQPSPLFYFHTQRGTKITSNMNKCTILIFYIVICIYSGTKIAIQLSIDNLLTNILYALLQYFT